MSTRPVVGCVLVAAGAGSRLGLGIPKALATAGGASLLELAVGTLAGPAVDRLVVVVPAAEHATCTALVRRAWSEAGRTDDVVVVPGGADRQASVAAGLAALDPAAEVVLVHDAARALAPPALVAAVADAVRGDVVAVVPGLTPADTVKRLRAADDDPAGPGLRSVAETLDRSGLVAVQTPQGFQAHVLRALHEAAAAAGPATPGGATDDAGMAEAAGHRVVVVPGHPEAFKVTTALDLVLARALLQQRRSGQDDVRDR